MPVIDEAAANFQVEKSKLRLGIQAAFADLSTSEDSILPHLVDLFDYDTLLRVLLVLGGETIYIPTVEQIVDSLRAATAARMLINGEVATVSEASNINGVAMNRVERILKVLQEVRSREEKMSAEKKELLSRVGMLDLV